MIILSHLLPVLSNYTKELKKVIKQSVWTRSTSMMSVTSAANLKSSHLPCVRSRYKTELCVLVENQIACTVAMHNEPYAAKKHEADRHFDFWL